MAEQPNIILINCDDLGYGDLGCYGSTVNATPNLDRLAAEGMRFTDFYMASPWCSPSRAAMLTGCYPKRIGFDCGVLFPGQAEGLDPNETTVARLLKDVGYDTAIVGKWHCGDQPEFLPTRHGFDRYYGIPYSNDMGRQLNADGSLRQPQGKARPPLPLMRDETVIQQQPDQTGITERYVEECVRFLRQDRDKPFFLYFAHMYVHLPLYVPELFMRASRNGRYGAAVACIDWSVGVLMHELRELGLADNTLVLFTSDNGSRMSDGGGSNGVLRGTKGTTWDGGMRLPLIAWKPGLVPAGSEQTALAASMDLLPTLCNLAGASLPELPIDGVDITALLRGEEASPREHFHYYANSRLEAVRDERWKLHVHKSRHQNMEVVRELYDLRADPGETRNCAAEEPEVVARLQGLLSSMRDELGDAVANAPGRACRPVGLASNPDTLTHYDPEHPYVIAEYDLSESG